MNILFPTDFSESSARGMAAAVLLAEKWRLPILATHIYRPPVVSMAADDTGLELINESILTNLEDSYREQMQHFCREMRVKYRLEERNLVLEEKVEMGIPVPDLIRQVTAYQSRCVVITGSKKDGIDRLLYGSVTQGLVNKCPVPLLIIPDDVPFSGFDRIAYATDLTFDDNRIIGTLLEIGHDFDARIYCFHVHDSNLDAEMALIDELSNTYKSEVEAGRISFHVTENLQINDGIRYFVEEHDIDLLVMLRQRRYWFDLFEPKHTRTFSLEHSVPLLIFHEA